MTVHAIPHVRGESLGTHLAGLGLLRVLADQADPTVRSYFDGDSLIIETTVDDLAAWLVDDYTPTPVLSPWNEGSGFGAKDRAPKEALNRLLANESPRLDPFRAAYNAVTTVALQARNEGWSKARIIKTLRSLCPDPMLPWLDTAVVALGEDRLAFPPILGTGGNDGRLDFSTNFHQRLLEAWPSDAKRRASSLRSAQDWLGGTASTPLSIAAVGQFDPGAAGTPNTSPFGAAPSLVNPWVFILMVEGSLWFASAPARRLDSETSHDARAAMTFMTHGDAAGSTTGASGEESRGEIWFPWWERSLSAAAVRQLFAEGRAVWRRRTATRSDQMYLATATRGVSPATTGFDRYTIIRRNGLAFSAVLADHVKVHDDDAATLVADVEDWMNNLSRKPLPITVRSAVHRFEVARVALVKANSTRRQAAAIAKLLGSVTDAEIAVGRSGRTRDDIKPWARPREARRLVDLLRDPSWRLVSDQPEFRIALGIASIVTPPLRDSPRGRSMRELLLPIDPPSGRTDRPGWRSAPIVPGLGQRRLIDVLADVTAWLVMSAPTKSEVNERESGSAGGITLPRIGIRVPWVDVHAWASGALSDDQIGYWLHALLALDWRSQDLAWPDPDATPSLINPTLALLMPFRVGISARGTTEHNAGVYGLQPIWVGQLTRGHPDRAHTAAQQRLRQLGYDAVSPGERTGQQLDYGRRLAAALLPMTRYQEPLRRIAEPINQEDRYLTNDPAKENA